MADNQNLNTRLTIQAGVSGSNQIENLTENLQEMEQAIDAQNQQTREASSVWDKFKGKLLGVGTALTAVFAGLGAGRFLGDAVAQSKDFEKQLSTLKAISGSSAEQMEKLKSASEAMGATTQYNAMQSAQALEELLRAGLSAENAIAGLPSVLALAQGNSLELAESASFITQAANGMGIAMSDSARIADVLAKASSSAATNVQGLGAGLSYVAPTANSLGLSLEQTVAYLGKFADAGIDGSRAGTSLNNMLSQFANSSSTFRQELDKLGIRTNDFNQAIRELANAGVKGQSAINALGMEAGPAFRALVGQGLDSLDALTKKLENASGTALNQAQEMDNNLQGALSGLESAWDNIKLKLSEPLLKPLAEKARELSDVFTQMADSGKIKEFGEKLSGIFDSISTSFLNFVRNLSVQGWADGIISVFEKIKIAGSALSNVFSLLSATWNGLKISFQAVASVILGLIGGLMDGFAGLVSVLGKMGQALGIGGQSLENFAQLVQNSSAQLADLQQQIDEDFWANGQKVRDSLSNVLEISTDTAQQSAEVLAQIPQTAEEALAQGAGVIQQALSETAENAESLGETVSQTAGKTLSELNSLLAEQANTQNEALAQSQKISAETLQKQAEAVETSRQVFNQIGVDLNGVMDGVSSKTNKAMADYLYAVRQATTGGLDATKLARAGFEELAKSMNSPQDWQALKNQLAQSGQAMDLLSKDQLKRLEDGIKNIPNQAKTAFDNFKNIIGSADNLGALENLKGKLQSAFSGGELSAQQYAEAQNLLKAKTQELAQISIQAHAQIQQAQTQTAITAQNSVNSQIVNNQALANSVKNVGEVSRQSHSATFKVFEASQFTAEQVAQLTVATQRWSNAVMKGFGNSGMMQYANDLGKSLIAMRNAMKANNEEIKRANEEITLLDNKIADGTINTIEDLNEAIEKSRINTNALDETTLNRFNATIAKAHARIKALGDEAKNIADDLEGQLARALGNEEKALQLAHTKKIADLEAKLATARQQKNNVAVSEYQRAINLQQQINAVEIQKHQSEQKNKQNQELRTPSYHSQNTDLNQKAHEFNDVLDKQVQNAYRAGENQGQANFMNALTNDRKRRAL